MGDALGVPFGLCPGPLYARQRTDQYLPYPYLETMHKGVPPARQPPVLFPEFAERCDDARAFLRKHMTERGLHERDGWYIYEFTREVGGRTELAMRPIHPHLTPPDIECVCKIERPGAPVASTCTA